MDETNEKQDGVLEKTEQDAQTPNWEERAKSLEAEVAKFKRIAERNAKKAKEDDAEQPSSFRETKDSTDLDYGQKAFLKASGISGSDELALAKEFMKRTGDSLDSIVEDDIFKARLERLRTTKENALAAESKGRGNTSSGRDSAEYWLAKLGPNEQVPADIPQALRQKIVEARRSQGKSTKVFYND